jgi:hypothetical protein
MRNESDDKIIVWAFGIPENWGPVCRTAGLKCTESFIRVMRAAQLPQPYKHGR